MYNKRSELVRDFVWLTRKKRFLKTWALGRWLAFIKICCWLNYIEHLVDHDWQKNLVKFVWTHPCLIISSSIINITMFGPFIHFSLLKCHHTSTKIIDVSKITNSFCGRQQYHFRHYSHRQSKFRFYISHAACKN